MSELKQRWQTLREAQSGLRIRDAAAQLGVSEAALLETRIGEGVARLAARTDRLCAALPHLGTVMSLVRNEAAVHEKDIAFDVGVEQEGRFHFEGEGFALSLLSSSVAHAFHVEDTSPKGALRSIQLFDAAGTALWKIYARDKADHAAFARLLAELAWPDDVRAMPFARPAITRSPAPAHQPVDLQALLEAIAANAIPIMLEVANHGVRQSHRGPLIRIARMGPWLNVLDPGFDWHLNQSGLATVWLDRGDNAGVILHLAGGGEAARLTVSPEATAQQRGTWSGILEKAVAA
ncbi:ChuX/HutX family heme-like substrate-binding protein [Labrys okinawensis]|uniref:ChuX/HutX family heme-like substrate-binding protein n=1 Tax=Labrys okinawensis TaxID=346911 RepID=UPI0039BCC1D7